MKLALLATAAATALIGAGVTLGVQQASAQPPTPSPQPTPSTPDATSQRSGAARVAVFYRALDSTQRDCLAAASVQAPAGKLTDQQRQQLGVEAKAALVGCGVRLPDRLATKTRLGVAWSRLSSEQQHCLADIELTRPGGKLTPAQRTAFRQALQAAIVRCGIS
ncbi:hypothetical protein [Propionicimonas sp.]|uniref:hypothetical protein n=1 Tax=Propionicimonas sp. TaxID=1955623 RepID=UPI0017F5D433|nr:hypothetical protein [Propionicimonas sp.]MBU3975528.1 hypothetical protein [Actinomycetota bacterium]MBA3020067.1 hypothetical protein [Propionicimonas sp.]MBU3986323.1 hypothetical protein [Actinomycetota bacterium]MBU4007892.1 hypothetical protein [Actinomycetota bacterium]MBU4064150.1 hypothetical protein [Actinomycetota bacterium]